jgi:hypothetical protein
VGGEHVDYSRMLGIGSLHTARRYQGSPAKQMESKNEATVFGG